MTQKKVANSSQVSDTPKEQAWGTAGYLVRVLHCPGAGEGWASGWTSGSQTVIHTCCDNQWSPDGKELHLGAGEMIQQLTVVLAKDPGSILSTHMTAHSH